MQKVTRPLLAVFLLLWLVLLLAAFYVAQRPTAIAVLPGIGRLLITLLLLALLLTLAAAMGSAALRRFFPTFEQSERLLLGTGMGLALLGLLAFFLAVLGWARPWVLLALLSVLTLLAIWRGWLIPALTDLTALWRLFTTPLPRPLRLLPVFALIALSLAFLLSLAPPADAFDALFYHFPVPQAWLDSGGLVTPGILPHAWFPALMESLFLWGLAFNNEQIPQMLHLAFGVLTLLLLWDWARRLSGLAIAWRSLFLAAAMPSLPLLASWAYTDLALAFFTLAVLTLLWRAAQGSSTRLWALIGIFCGLAMGIKYTSFLVPLFAFACLLLFQRRALRRLLPSAAVLVLTTILTACPWYVRNWVLMGNPVYPFVFGGASWDAFLASAFNSRLSQPGLGWNLRELLLLPFNASLGIHDANFFDGRIGVWWLALTPIALWVLARVRRVPRPLAQAVLLVTLFAVLSSLAWVAGVISTLALWQTRLLFPALIPLALLMALAWEQVAELDLPRLKVSFIFNIAILLSAALSLLDLGLFTYARHPLAYALGMQTREAYFERTQPAYADALALVAATPGDARVYSLFEPRSWGMERPVQPDTLNVNLAHELLLHGSPEAVLAQLKAQGYTHILYQRIGTKPGAEPPWTADFLDLLELTENRAHASLYRIP